MTEQESKTEKYIIEYTENYMEKVFYFCLKKTGNSTEAEDLTSEISLCVFTQLKRGANPEAFSAWVWRIARNRYSKWADAKHIKNDAVAGADIGDFELADDCDIENEFVRSEAFSLLRRELAFISSDYRNVVVAYYIDDISVRDIAARLNLTVDAVKKRLIRARKILKEGMEMAREFGKRSYSPENMSFTMNGLCGRNHEPWCYLYKSLCKNIMLAAYKTPSTAEELSVEVGVALPYMEEELSELVAATLMKKTGNKYETDFFIVSAEAQEKIYEHLRSVAPDLTKAIIAASEFEQDFYGKNNSEWCTGNQPKEDMRWAFLMMKTDTVNFDVLDAAGKPTYDNSAHNLGVWGHTIRPNGGEWDILGMEAYHGDEPMFVSLHGCVTTPDERDLPDIKFRHYTFQSFGQELFNQSVSYMDGQALVAIANGETQKAESVVINRLKQNGYISETQNVLTPNFAVIHKDRCEKMPQSIRENYEKLRYTAREIGIKHYKLCRDLIMAEIPDTLKNNKFQIDHACANIIAFRGAVIEEAIRTGYLTIPEDETRKKMLGAYLEI